MARDTDRKCVSEAVRLSKDWVLSHRHLLSGSTSIITLMRAGRTDGEHLVIRYGTKGQIVTADHNFSGIRNGIITDKRRRVLAIINQGRQAS